MKSNQNVDLIRKMMMLVESTNQKIQSSILSEQTITTQPEEGEVDEQVTQAAKAGTEMVADILKNEKGLFQTLKNEVPALSKFKNADEAIMALKSGELSTMDAFSIVKQANKVPEIAAKIKGLISDSQSFQSIAKKVYPKGIAMPANPENFKLASETLQKTYGMSAQEAEAALKQAAQKVGGSAGVTTKNIEGALARRSKELKGTSPEVVKAIGPEVIDPAKNIQNLEPVIKTTIGDSEYVRGLLEKWKKIKTWKPEVLQKIAKLRGRLNVKQIALYGLAGVGLYELLKGAFSGGDSDKTNTTLPTCVANFPNVEFTVGNGDVLVGYIKQNLDAESANHGGYYFFPNFRVFTKDNAMKGTYSCGAGEKKIQANIAEQGAIQQAVKNIQGVNQPKPIGPDSNDFVNSDLIKITWDGQGTTPTPNPNKSKYHDCSKKDVNKENLEFGCKSNQIKEIQVCLGMQEKYQTGNFGPLTKKAMLDAGYDASQGITATIYNTIKQKCSGKTADDTTDNIRAPRLANADFIKTTPVRSLPALGDLSTMLQNKLNASINQDIQPANTGITDRQKQILNNVMDRGFDVVYKGGTLTPEEQTWLANYYGGQVDKVKNNKDYGQKVRIQPNQQNDQNG